MRILILLNFAFIHVIMFGQTNKSKHDIVNNPDSTLDVVIVHSEMKGETNKEITRGFFKVLKVDTFNTFYLIFLERNNTRSTIYSVKSINETGTKIEVDRTYFFELICKDTLYNGTCISPIANVTYFGKYSGYELGKTYLAKNLNGLIITDSVYKKD